MKKTLTLSLLAATLAVGLASPALAEPSASVSGVVFTDFTWPTAVPGTPGTTAYVTAIGNRFSVSRSFLTGKFKLDDTWSGVVTLNTLALSYLGATSSANPTGSYSEPNNAILNLAYLQSNNLLIPGTNLQMGMIFSPWVEYELTQWGYRMLGNIPVNGGLSGGSMFIQPWDKGLRFNGNHDFGGFGLSYALAMLNGEGYRANELDGQKTYEARVTVSPFVPGLDLTAQYHRGNPAVMPARRPPAWPRPTPWKASWATTRRSCAPGWATSC